MNKHSILVVEDEALIAANLVQTLTSLGYTVHRPVSKGKDAILAIKAQQPDLVLMDIQLIGPMNGIEAAEKIRAIVDIPIIYLTSYTDDVRLKKAQLTEPYGYIVKPANSQELHATIKMALYKHELDRKLKESEEMFRSLIAASPDAIALTDMEGTVLMLNHQAEILVGDQWDTKTGTNILTIFPPEEQESLAKNIQLTLERGSIHSLEYTLIKRDDTRVPVELNTSVVMDPTGRQKRFMAIIRDITRRKWTEEKLRASEEKYRTLIETLNEGIWVIDKDAITTFVNPKMARILGYTMGDMTGRSLFSFMDETGRLLTEGYIERRQLGICEQHYLEFLRKDGTRIYASVEATSIRGKHGEYLGAIAGVIDITDRKKVEDALQESEKKYRLIVENSRDILFTLNNAGEFVYLSPSTTRILGYNPDDFIGLTFQSVIHPEDLPVVQDIFQRSITNSYKSQEGTECRIRHSSGEWRWHIIRGHVIHDAEGNVLFSGITNDITERKLAEEALRYNNLCLTTLNEMEREFAELPSGQRVEEQAVKKLSRMSGAVVTVFCVYDPVLQMLMTSVIEIAPGLLGGMPGVREIANRLLGMKLEDIQYPLSKEMYQDINQNTVGLKKTITELSYGQIPPLIGASIQSLAGIDHFFHIAHVIDGELYGTSVMGLKPGSSDPPMEFLESFAHIVAVSLRRQQADEALRKSELNYRNIFEKSVTGLFKTTPDGSLIDVNDAFARLYDYSSAAEMLADSKAGKHLYISRHLYANPEDRKEIHHILAEKGEIKNYETLHIKRDGTHLWVSITARVIQDTDSNVLLFEGSIINITERKRAEEAIRQANKKLTLLSSITRHDINNQLTILMGYLIIMEKKQTDPTLNEYFSKVSIAAQRIASMIQFTKVYEKIGVNAPVWHDCRTIVDTVAKQAPLGKVVMKNDLPADVEVFADPLVVKVFYNLMDNAVRYGGKITTIRFSVQEHEGYHIVVCEDDGDGVVAGEKKKIFERGFGKNTGLGLALAREILDITGITITETGEPGKGARFEMAVPKGAWRMKGDGA